MIILFLGSLFFCILIHELAHLIVAKSVGCGVEVFSIGFGKPIYSFEWKGTRYNFSLFLLGGYCKLHDELTTSNDPTAFINLPYLKKFLIAMAGVTINVVIGTIAILLGKSLLNPILWYFGYLSIILGIGNALPLAPCLDGGYVVYLPLFIKIWGDKKGLEIFSKSCAISFKILMILNILCIPLLIHLILRRE
jgi:membrane-associated protease RseP (regulator of RpoE activity)